MPLNKKQKAVLSGFASLAVSDIRRELTDQPDMLGQPVISAIRRTLLESRLATPLRQGMSRTLVALLPDSFQVIEDILSREAPKGIHESHFTIFAALEKSDFNNLEQAGLEYLLVNYLRQAKSTASYGAWKAGLTLADAWLSARSETRLVELLSNARYSAGRLGALNGYEYVLSHRKKLCERDFAPILEASKTDPSERVRKMAKFVSKHQLPRPTR